MNWQWTGLVMGLVCVASLANLPRLARAEDSPSPQADNSAADRAWLQDQYLEDAKGYKFASDSGGAKLLDFESKPVMHWASHNDWSGDIFVWSSGGRPAVIGCMLAGPNLNGHRNFFHEFHAVSLEQPPTRPLANGNSWLIEGAPIKLLEVPNGPIPPASERAWLSGMREVAREFTFHTIFQKGTWELRLLPQPIHRYRNPQRASKNSEANSDGLDWGEGAIFAFVQSTGTDAEALLMIEGRRTPKGFRWHFAPVRMTNNPLWLTREGTELWRVGQHNDPPGNKILPYTTSFVGTRKVESAAQPKP